MIGIHNAIKGNKSVGFGSLDSWSSKGIPNMIKTPVQSIQVPRKIRVGDDNTILEENANAYDRLRDTILPFARGVNPMVSVQMQNQGGLFSNQGQTYLPYRIQSFRPPIMRQEDTMPLSRLPRLSTNVDTLHVKKTDKKIFENVKCNKNRLLVEFNNAAQPKAFKEHKVNPIELNHGRRTSRQNTNNRNFKRLEKINFENPEVNLRNQLIISHDQPQLVKSKIHTLPDYDISLKDKNNNIHFESNKNSKGFRLGSQDSQLYTLVYEERPNIEYENAKRLLPRYDHENTSFHNSSLQFRKLQIPIVANNTNLGYKNAPVNFELDFTPLKINTPQLVNVAREEYDRSESSIAIKDRAISQHSYTVS